MRNVVKILFLGANPSDTTRLRLDKEIRSIDRALRQTEFRDNFDIQQHWAVQVTDLQSCLLRHKPDIVHFSGHGSRTSEIILEDNTGGSHSVSTRALHQLFGVLKDNIRCVVLNACYSEKQAQVIAQHIDCVVGMSQVIGDSAAISFATAFYQAIGYGRDVRTAFELGCVQIDLENLAQQDIPKLICSNCDPHDVVFTPVATQENVVISEQPQECIKPDVDRLRTHRDRMDKARLRISDYQQIVNLRPLNVTHTFQDRVREMYKLCEYLAEDNVRLISVVGRGGMGKTALISRIFADLESGTLHIPDKKLESAIDGIIYLGARTTGLGLERLYADVGLMLGESIASRLAIRWADQDATLTTKVEYLLEVMQEGLYIIVLDNLEDELTEDGEIAADGLRTFVNCCLLQPSGARLVTTSREQIRIPPAAFHSSRQILLRDGLPESDAVVLLRELDPQGTLGLRDASESELCRVVQLVAGIPRALEILAGILYHDPTVTINQLVADKNLFEERVVDRLVAVGYHRLSEHERRVMEALSIFNRPVSAADIAFLLHSWYPDLNVRACLRRLVCSYFVKSNRKIGKYSLHPLDQKYAYQHIPKGSQENTEIYTRRNAELRAAEFYAGLCKAESNWRSIEDLEPHLAESKHLIQAGEFQRAAILLDEIDPRLEQWGFSTLVIRIRQQLVGKLDQKLEQVNLGRLSRCYTNLGNYQTALDLCHRALSVCREVKDRRYESQLLTEFGRILFLQGEVERSVEIYERALYICDELGDSLQESLINGYLGRALVFLGKPHKAIELYEKAITLIQESEDKQNLTMMWGNLGRAYLSVGQFEPAITSHTRSLALACETGNRIEEARQLGYIGQVYVFMDDGETAIDYYHQAISLSRLFGERRGESIWMGGAGQAYISMGNTDKAVEYLQQAIAISQKIKDRLTEEIWIGNLGRAYLLEGNYDLAIESFNKALHLSQEIHHRENEGAWIGNLGLVYAELNDFDQAIQLYNQALAISREIGDRRLEGAWLGRIGTALSKKCEVNLAIEHFAQALSISEEIGDENKKEKWARLLIALYGKTGQKDKAGEIIALLQETED